MTVSLGDLEVAVEVRAELGEGPLWDAAGRFLYFVDILQGRVHRVTPGAARGATPIPRTYEIGQPVGAIALAGAGDLVLAVRDGFARLDLDTGRVAMIADVERDRRDTRMNDGACDPAGRFWAGTKALDERRGAGALYRLDPDGRVRAMLANVTISNGLDWSADGTRMFYVDTGTGSIDVFDFDPDAGEIANRRAFVRVPPESGAPDGLTLDADGFLWLALWGGGALHRYAPDGARDRVVTLPVTRPTSIAFGGDDLGDLYVTSATIGLSPEQRAAQPHAGRVLRLRPGVTGRPPFGFKG
jgi:sugar lactone lactonase YvrE